MKAEERKIDFMLYEYDSQFYTLFNTLSVLDKIFLLITVSYNILVYTKMSCLSRLQKRMGKHCSLEYKSQ